MDNKEILKRALKAWQKVISLLKTSNDSVDHMRSALRQVAEIVRDEIEGNRELGQNLLSILNGLNDQQIRDLHRKWLSDAQKAEQSCIETAKTLGYSINSKCFIATAACGALSEEVIVFSLFRDKVLHNFFLGRIFIRIYYAISPPLASLIRSSTHSQYLVRKVLVHPITNIAQIILNSTTMH